MWFYCQNTMKKTVLYFINKHKGRPLDVILLTVAKISVAGCFCKNIATCRATNSIYSGVID